MFCTAPTADADLASPQANPDDATGSVCQRTWADEVEAYARDLQARLGAMNRLRIAAITVEQANRYIAQWHRHNKPRLAKFAISVVDGTGTVRGVALVGRPVAPALDDGMAAEILRVATDGTRNACSMLYGAARRAARAMGHDPVITYSLPEEGGASLRAAGFRLDKADAGGSSAMWHNRPGRTVAPVGDDLVGGKWRWVA